MYKTRSSETRLKDRQPEVETTISVFMTRQRLLTKEK